MKQQIVIIGGGIAGIVSALTATKFGFNVILIEQQKNLGGLLRSFKTQSGYIFDHGTHLLNATSNSELNNMVFDSMNKDFYSTLPPGGDGNFYKKIDENSSFLDVRKLPKGDYEKAMFELLECNETDKNFENLEDQLESTFGHTIYTNILAPIIQKLFGMDAHLLSPDSHLLFGIKRVIAFSSKTSDLLKTIKVYDDKLAYHTRKFDENSKTFYPKQGGVGSWIDKLLEQLVQNGVKILTEQTIVDIEHHNCKITGITLKSGKKIQCDQLVWTLPAVFLNNIVNKNIESGKNTVKPMFVTNSLYHFVIDKPYLTKSYFLYFYEPSFRSFRATFYNNFRVEKTDKYLVTVEVISNPSFKDIPDKQDIFNELKESKSIPDDANFIECSINELAAGFPLPTKDLAQNNTMMYEKIIESFHNISMLGKSSNSGFFMQDVMVSSFNEIQKVSDKFK
jgi:protoporphyrinogen oxidase